VPTYFGAFVYDPATQWPVIGQYAGIAPIGAAYAPDRDRLYLPMANTNYVAVYDSQTMTETGRIEMPSSFSWTGNWAFEQGRIKVLADGRYMFVSLADGVVITTLRRR
jgi:hypothetical protein